MKEVPIPMRVDILHVVLHYPIQQLHSIWSDVLNRNSILPGKSTQKNLLSRIPLVHLEARSNEVGVLSRPTIVLLQKGQGSGKVSSHTSLFQVLKRGEILKDSSGFDVEAWWNKAATALQLARVLRVISQRGLP
jgi:hypothetical protein